MYTEFKESAVEDAQAGYRYKIAAFFGLFRLTYKAMLMTKRAHEQTEMTRESKICMYKRRGFTIFGFWYLTGREG